jgi:hypothetical protein
VYRDWQLPAAFTHLRAALGKRLGLRTGTRHFIRVLQLLAQHPLARVERAIVLCQARGIADAAAIADQVQRLAHATPLMSDNDLSPSDNALSPHAAPLAAVRVPPPDLSQFNRLLSPRSQGDHTDDPANPAAVDNQPQAAQVADHAGRV